MFKYLGHYSLYGNLMHVARIRAWTLQDALKKFRKFLYENHVYAKEGNITVMLLAKTDLVN